MRLEDRMPPIALAKFEYRNHAVRGGAGEEAAAFVGGPGNDVDGGGV